MWLGRSNVPELASAIAKTLVDKKLIETESVADVQADVGAVLDQYLNDEQEISNKARDIAQARGLPPAEASRLKRELAKQKNVGVGDDSMDYVLDQLLEMLMHSASVEEIFAADHELKRAMREPMRANEAAQEKLEGTLRGRLKHVQEGTAQWEIEYRRLREEVERRRKS
jgi:uncharacterized protein